MVEKKQKSDTKSISPKNVPQRGERFYKAWESYWGAGYKEEISKVLNEPALRLETQNLSSRTLNHWEQQGLISIVRSGDRGWRKYSIMDKIWVNIIIELRDFGFSLVKIKKVKKSLEKLSKSKLYSKFPILEMYTVDTVANKTPVYLLVFANGDAQPLTQTEYKIENKFRNLSNHIKINLNQIVQKVLPRQDLSPRFKPELELGFEELELIFMIRMTDYDIISLKTNAGKIERLEASKSVRNETRIIDLIRAGDYQDIEIKQRDGKIVQIRQKTIIKYKQEK